MDFANEIRSRLDTQEVFEYYGLRPNRSGFVCCFSHNERTPSLKVYKGNGGYYCFGCGAHGSVIDFVMQYFSISFLDAIKKLNEDFSLGLPIGKKIDRRKQLEMQRQAFMRKREMNERKAKQEELDKAYWDAFEEWKRLDNNIRNYAPASPSDPLHPLYVEALKNISCAEYNLSCAEIARYEYENRDCRNS